MKQLTLVNTSEPLAKKVLLVGEMNPYGSDPGYALYPEPAGSAGGRMCRLVLGITEHSYLRRYARVNLCAGKWSPERARFAADRLLPDHRPDVVVMLGRKVAVACSMGHIPAFSSVARTDYERLAIVQFVALPHPSGRCRSWNEPGAFERAREVLARVGAA